MHHFTVRDAEKPLIKDITQASQNYFHTGFVTIFDMIRHDHEDTRTTFSAAKIIYILIHGCLIKMLFVHLQEGRGFCEHAEWIRVLQKGNNWLGETGEIQCKHILSRLLVLHILIGRLSLAWRQWNCCYHNSQRKVHYLYPNAVECESWREFPVSVGQLQALFHIPLYCTTRIIGSIRMKKTIIMKRGSNSRTLHYWFW